MNCPSCGFEQPPQKLCDRCGLVLPVAAPPRPKAPAAQEVCRCPQCGSRSAEARCPGCGIPLRDRTFI